MSGPTLCGVINKFPSKNDCSHLGDMCDGTGDEPGDSYDERCKYAIDGRFIDVSFDSFCTADDLRDADEEGEEGSTEDEIEMQGEYAHFCAMSFRQQAKYVATMRAKICALIGVSSQSWEPSDAFILDAIQDETPNDVLKDMAYAAYLASYDPFEQNPSDVEPELPADDDCIRVPQQGSSGKSDQLRDFDHGRSYRTRCKESNSRKKKCWHSHRRETIRRDTEHFFGFAGKGDGFDQYVDHLEEFVVEEDHHDRYLREVSDLDWDDSLAFPAVALNAAFEEMERLKQFDSRYVRGRYDYERPVFDLRPRRSSDWFDDWFDDMSACSCFACMGDWDDYRDSSDSDVRDDEQDLIDRFGDRFDGQDDIFAGYGETDADIDRVFPRFSSSNRFSYRFRGLSPRKQEALQC